jgi:hypothetical protein
MDPMPDYNSLPGADLERFHCLSEIARKAEEKAVSMERDFRIWLAIAGMLSFLFFGLTAGLLGWIAHRCQWSDGRLVFSFVVAGLFSLFAQGCAGQRVATLLRRYRREDATAKACCQKYLRSLSDRCRLRNRIRLTPRDAPPM